MTHFLFLFYIDIWQASSIDFHDTKKCCDIMLFRGWTFESQNKMEEKKDTTMCLKRKNFRQ